MNIAESVRVNVEYRPMRIGMLIPKGDWEAFRKAVKINYCLWGGRYNPILQIEESSDIPKLVADHNLDFVETIGNCPTSVEEKVKSIRMSMKSMCFYDGVFSSSGTSRNACTLLDLHNLLHHYYKDHDFRRLMRGFRSYSWSQNDPLADMFLVHLGQLPLAEETEIDYTDLILKSFNKKSINISLQEELSPSILSHPSIPQVNRFGLSSRSGVLMGCFIGSILCLDDLITWWNLRASEGVLLFVDPDHIIRMKTLLPAWAELLHQVSVGWSVYERTLNLISSDEVAQELDEHFSGAQMPIVRMPIDAMDGRIEGRSFRLGEGISTLGVVQDHNGTPQVTFALSEKPFSSHAEFWNQNLMANVKIDSACGRKLGFTFSPPFIPKLWKFYEKHLALYNDYLKVCAEGLDLAIKTNESDQRVNAVNVEEMTKAALGLGGFKVFDSPSGLLTKQIIGALGGLQGGRVFKIPGVRRLLKAFGPKTPFSKNDALSKIGSSGSDFPDFHFKDYESLFIEPRTEEKLNQHMVFEYLVTKGIFRIGIELCCPNCLMNTWLPIDGVKHVVSCDLCGGSYDATRQLVRKSWSYRRSSLLGADQNAAGAIPVILVLQQLATALRIFDNAFYSTALELTGSDGFKCEVDFVWMQYNRRSQKVDIILGESKDQWNVRFEDFERDVLNLAKVLESLPDEQFAKYLLMSKLAKFSEEEIRFLRDFAASSSVKVIVLTHDQLEPYFMYERFRGKNGRRIYASTPEALAEASQEIFLNAI